MTIEEFIKAAIPTTQPNEFGVYVEETPIEIANTKNKQLIVRCAYNGKEYMFGQSWWRGTSGSGSPVSDRYSTKYTDKQSGLIKHLTELLELQSFAPFAKEIAEVISKLKRKQLTIFDMLCQ